ncbi:FecR family protein [Pyxidicoccus trucidator]|uniref:FecR family protein n=1 Tax=Pyxidicoccus trucidator TaxID=2709662 RepID=UPI0013DA00D3|nr:FecR family protein [Pyxidicoccus trucidator]
MRRDRWFPTAVVAALVLLCAPGLAAAAVGRVVTVQGTAWRTPEGAERQPLTPDVEIEQKDTLEVESESGVKLLLNDGSVLLLSADSHLVITEAEFAGQERKGFVGYLKLGKVWAEVKKALSGSEAKFEVKTDRAVAGVRGTTLRVDVAPPVSSGALSPSTVVQVYSGLVKVAVRVPKAKAPPVTAPRPGERKEVPGPREVTVEEWEEIVRDLRKNKQIEVGERVGPVTDLDTKRRDDAFGAFIQSNRGLKRP